MCFYCVLPLKNTLKKGMIENNCVFLGVCAMVSSMTGYGRARGEKGGVDLTVEIKSVNSRYFEYSSRMPRAFAFLEERL